MDRINVKSSNIQSIGYDPESKLLEIEFRNGSIYQYNNVPLNEHKSLMSASSHGSYFNKNIRNYYQTKRVR